MIGLPEIAILVVIVLVLLGGYRKLPQLGRSAGESTRKLGKGARRLGDSASEKIGQEVDPSSIGRSAGKHVREARELRDSFTGATSGARSSKSSSEPGGGDSDEGQSAPPAGEAAGQAESRRADSNR